MSRTYLINKLLTTIRLDATLSLCNRAYDTKAILLKKSLFFCWHTENRDTIKTRFHTKLSHVCCLHFSSWNKSSNVAREAQPRNTTTHSKQKVLQKCSKIQYWIADPGMVMGSHNIFFEWIFEGNNNSLKQIMSCLHLTRKNLDIDFNGLWFNAVTKKCNFIKIVRKVT